MELFKKLSEKDIKTMKSTGWLFLVIGLLGVNALWVVGLVFLIAAYASK